MSRREDSSNSRVSPRALERRLKAISKQRSMGDPNQENIRARNSVEGHRSKGSRGSRGSRTERSISIEDPDAFEKYIDMIRELKRFYEGFKRYSMNQDIRESLNGVISDDMEEDPIQILKCMNYMIELLLNSSEKEKYKSDISQSEKCNDYEELLQKAENDIRQHIRIEQQMKLLIDSLQARVDELEKTDLSASDSTDKPPKETRSDTSKLLELVRQKDEELSNVQKMLKQKEEEIKSFEEKMLSVAILEHTLKSEKESHRKDKENIRNYYEQELASVTKEAHHIQRILSINLPIESKVKLLQEELFSSKDFNMKKIQLLENRLRQLDDIPSASEREETEPTVMYTDPGLDDRRHSFHPAATTASIMKSRGYDLKSHRCSTEIYGKNVENKNHQQNRQTPPKHKKDVINELKSTPILGQRSMSKGSIRGDQPQQVPLKTMRDHDNYFNYLKKKLDNLHQPVEKEREHLKSFDARRSSSVKRGVYLAASTGLTKEKSSERGGKGDISRTQEERSDYLNSDKNVKTVPKLLRTANSTIHAKILKH